MEAFRLLTQALWLLERERLRLAASLLATSEGPPEPDAAGAWDEDSTRRSRGIEEGLGGTLGAEWLLFGKEGRARKTRGGGRGLAPFQPEAFTGYGV